MKKICLTGGGSAGHVIPNIALTEMLKQDNWDIHYIGSHDGIEQELITALKLPYYPINAGKLRREYTLKNLLTPFQVVTGIVQAWRHLGKIKPDIVFSKGGFVSFPVVFAAWCRRIPVIIHESDLTPGLANRLSFPFAQTVCVTFPEGKHYFKAKDNIVVSGTPIRQQLFNGNKAKGLQWCGFNNQKPIILVMGGGAGAQSINRVIRSVLDELLKSYQVIHICGAGKCDAEYTHYHGYKQVDYIHDELADVFACADMIISRAGANSLYEILALKKPHILIPLPTHASRGDQIDNAKYYQKLGISLVIFEENLTPKTLLQGLQHLQNHGHDYQQKLAQAVIPNGSDEILKQIHAISQRH